MVWLEPPRRQPLSNTNALLGIQHELWTTTLNGNLLESVSNQSLRSAPGQRTMDSRNRGKYILDLGCGSGLWAMDVGTMGKEPFLATL